MKERIIEEVVIDGNYTYRITRDDDGKFWLVYRWGDDEWKDCDNFEYMYDVYNCFYERPGQHIMDGCTTGANEFRVYCKAEQENIL